MELERECVCVREREKERERKRMSGRRSFKSRVREWGMEDCKTKTERDTAQKSLRKLIQRRWKRKSKQKRAKIGFRNWENERELGFLVSERERDREGGGGLKEIFQLLLVLEGLVCNFRHLTANCSIGQFNGVANFPLSFNFNYLSVCLQKEP